MKRIFLPTAVIALLLILVLFLKRRSAPITADPQPADCAAGTVEIHSASTEARDILETALANDRGTGISAAVVIDGELVFSAAVGHADQDQQLGPNARMRTGSVAKLFTAVAAARLSEMNLLDLHEPIAPLVPEIQNPAITAYHLGTHTSGIRHYDFGNMAEANNRRRFDSMTDALDLFVTDPLLSPPGTSFHYSSFGFNLLAVVVERAYGAPYDEALLELVASPLGIFSLGIDDVWAAVPCRPSFSSLAFGRIGLDAPWRDNSDLYPSGGLLISARDLAVFADAVFNTDFLHPETIELFKLGVATPDGAFTGYSFGWQIGRSDDGTIEWFGHGGLINGAYASVRYYPASRMVVAGMANYNYWLTSKQPNFFSAVREEIPRLFSSK